MWVCTIDSSISFWNLQSFYSDLFFITQVKVPDPEIVKELEKSHEEIALVQTEVTTLQETISTLKTEISQQNSELAQQRSRIAELEAQLATVQAGGGVVAPLGLPGSTVSDEVSFQAFSLENFLFGI